MFCVIGFVLMALTGCATTSLPDFTGLVKHVAPAVVNISTTQRVSEENFQAQPPEGSDWQPGQDDASPHVYDEQSLGSGFIISHDGYILTNYHVVEDADRIVVKLSDRRQLPARLVGSDARSDIALLKIKANHLPVVKIGDDRKLEVGSWVLAIGSPYGFEHSVTAGIVSAKGRNLSDEEYVPFIQTDVAINPGNSGGPLFNENGQVVGINSQIYSRTGGYMGLSFAVPINVAMRAVRQLKQSGHVSRGWLGVIVQNVDRGLADSFGMNRPEGALVDRVVSHSPAAQAGIAVGDVILRFNGEAVDTSGGLPPLVGATSPGQRVKIVLLHKQQRKVVTVRLGALRDHTASAGGQRSKAPGASAHDRLGLTVENLTAAQRRELHVGSTGVLISDIQSGAAAQAGLQVGDVITMAAGHKIKNVSQFEKIMGSLPKGSMVALLVRHHGRNQFVAVELPQ